MASSASMPAAAASASWLPVGSLVFGILSVIFFWIPIMGFLLGVTGIIMAVVSLRKERNPLAATGLVVSFIGAVIGLVPILLAIIALLSN